MEQKIGVKAIIQNEAGETLLIKRSSKYDHLENQFDIPGGRINFGEDPLVGLQREIKEETNLDLNTVKSIIDVSTVFKSEEKHIVRITYHCTIKPESLTNLKLSEEHIGHTWRNTNDMNQEDFKDQLLWSALRKIQ
jgi:8-oxo-dGTP diphosphatase